MTLLARTSGFFALVCGVAVAVPLSLPADATPAAMPAARALPVTNGPLLLGDDLINADGSQHQIKVTGATMAFSPDGGRVAGVSLGNVIHIWSADGTDQVVATLPQTVRDVTWSSDSTSLAALTGDFGNFAHSIYVIPLATRVPALVYTDNADNRINLENGLSWQPGGTQILFTSNLPFVIGAKNITQQLFTVSTTGGSPTQFFEPPALATDPEYRFGTPEWAPDGARIAVWVQETGTVPAPYQDTYLSVMTAGVAPTQLRPVHVTPPAAAGPYWSTDGTALLFSDVPAGPGPAPATVIAATGAALLGTYAYGGQITDWQPCPTGTCVVWGLHTARTLSLQASKKKVTKGRKVTFTGAVVAGGVSVCTAGQAVDLQKAGMGRHARFRHLAGATTDATGRFTMKVKVRKTARYRVVVTEVPDCRSATSAEVKVRAKAKKPHK
jgi:hypothetical protein